MKTNNNKLSIITVVKNCEKKILLTMKSVESQSYKNYEHIIIDGFSEDNTYSIIKKFKSDKVIVNRNEDKNLYDAINFALRKSTGDYILFLHSGDLFYSEHSLREINAQGQSHVDVILGGCIFYNPKNFKISRIWKVINSKINLKNTYKLPHTGTIIHKKFIKIIGQYNINYNISSDTDYLMRLFSKKNLNIKLLNNFICYMETGGISSSYKNFIQKVVQDIKILNYFFGKMSFYYYILKITYKLLHFIDKSNIEVYTKNLKQQVHNLNWQNNL